MAQKSTKSGSILSVTKSAVENPNDFEFECRVRKGHLQFIAEMTLLDAIRSGRFIEKSMIESNQNDAENDEKVPPVFLIKMLGHGVKQLIMDNQYKITSPFSTKSGISVSFTHPFLKLVYILHINGAQFRKELDDIKNLDQDQVQVLVKELFNKCQSLEKQIKMQDQVIFLSRSSLMNVETPFDINWSQDELIGSSHTLQDVALKALEKNDFSALGNRIQQIDQNNRKQKNNHDSQDLSILADLIESNAMTIHPTYQKRSVCYSDSKYITFLPKLQELIGYTVDSPTHNSLRMEFNKGQWYLRGPIRIKSSILSNTLGSFNNFVFGQKSYIIGIINDEYVVPNMKTKLFLIRYCRNYQSKLLAQSMHYSSKTKQQPKYQTLSSEYYVVYMVELKKKILTINFVKAYQNDSNSNNSMTSTEQFNENAPRYQSFSTVAHCVVCLSNETKMEIQFNLPLFVE